MILKRILVICVAIISCTQLYLVILEQTAHITEETTVTDWLSVLAYFLTLFAAVSAAIFAWNANQINKLLLEMQNRPTVEFTLFFLPNFFGMITLEFKNSSKNIARKLEFNFEILKEDQFENAKKMIEKLKYVQFSDVGLNSLSSLETRYLGFINTNDLMIENGNAKIKVTVNYEDVKGKRDSNFYELSLDELKGISKIGKSFDEQNIEQLRGINNKLQGLRIECKNFKNEYEKTHREWTEAEFREKVRYFDKNRAILKATKQLEPVNLVDKRVARKESIHKLRKQNK